MGDTEKPGISACFIYQMGICSLLGVKDTGLLQCLGKDWDGGVDRVGDDEDESLGAGVGDSLGKGRTDTSVNLMISYSSLLQYILHEAHFLHGVS